MINTLSSFNYADRFMSLANNYKDSAQRHERAYQQTLALNAYSPVYKWTKKQRIDALLSYPDSTNNKFLQLIICMTRRLEDLAEVSSDLSTFMAKRLKITMTPKNNHSESKEFFIDVFTAAFGRAIMVALSSWVGVILKASGSALYFLSFVLAGLAVALNGGGITQKQANRITHIKPNDHHLKSTSKIIGLHTKQFTKKLSFKETQSWQQTKLIQPSTQRYISPYELIKESKYDKHLGANIVRLFYSGLVLINKFSVSWDKHIGYQLRKGIEPITGTILSTRLLLGICTLCTAFKNILLMPINLSMSMIGFSVCMLTLIACGSVWMIINKKLVVEDIQKFQVKQTEKIRHALGNLKTCAQTLAMTSKEAIA